MIHLLAHHEAIVNPLTITCVVAWVTFAYRFTRSMIRADRAEDRGRQQ